MKFAENSASLSYFAVKMVAHNKTSKTLQEWYRVLCVMWSLDWWLLDNVIPLGHRFMTPDIICCWDSAGSPLNQNEKSPLDTKASAQLKFILWDRVAILLSWLFDWSIRFNRNLAFHFHNCGNLWRINLWSLSLFSPTKLCTPCVSRIVFFFSFFKCRFILDVVFLSGLRPMPVMTLLVKRKRMHLSKKIESLSNWRVRI